MLIFDYMRQPHVRRFVKEHNESERFKAILSDGCIIVHNALVHGAATRMKRREKNVRRKWGTLKSLATAALPEWEWQPLLLLIHAAADVRNAADHDLVTDDDIRLELISTYERISGRPFPGKGLREREVYSAHMMFATILFSLSRWQVGLGPASAEW